MDDQGAGAKPMQTREEILSRPRRSAIAIVTVDAGKSVPSAHGGGAGGVKAESEQPRRHHELSQ
jgi:hypothetical protein